MSNGQGYANISPSKQKTNYFILYPLPPKNNTQC